MLEGASSFEVPQAIPPADAPARPWCVKISLPHRKCLTEDPQQHQTGSVDQFPKS